MTDKIEGNTSWIKVSDQETLSKINKNTIIQAYNIKEPRRSVAKVIKMVQLAQQPLL